MLFRGYCRYLVKHELHQSWAPHSKMTQFQHHKYFPKEREVQLHLFPHVCFSCRKSYKKPAQQLPRACPECSGPLVRLSRKFKAPKVRDKQQWEKVKFLVEHGFLFYSVYERTSFGEIRVPYPKTLAEAREFVAAGNKREARGAQPSVPADRLRRPLN